MALNDRERLAAEAHELASGTFAYDSDKLLSLVLFQNRLLELMARGLPMQDTLDTMLVFLERDVPDMLCSVLLLDPDGRHLRHGSAPSLPEAYSRGIDGASIGPQAGSCGTAAYRAAQVIVSDIETDPLWDDYRLLARAHGLRACWSTPIMNTEGRVEGTFAMYFREPRRPARPHERLIELATHVASVAIAKDQRERAARDLQERYRLLNLATNDVVWDWDVAQNTLWWGDGMQRLLGYAESQMTNQLSWWVERVHPQDRDRVEASLGKAALQGSSWREDYRFLRRDGSYADIQDRGYVMRNAAGATVRMIGTMQDISERKQAQRLNELLAYREPLTQLPNRVALQKDLAAAVEHRQRHGGTLALLLLNLDCFRDINDSLGHHNGDVLLRKVAERLQGLISDRGMAASLGGDEFAVLLPEGGEAPDIELLLASIHEALQLPTEVAGIPLRLEATLGVALCPEHGTTVDLLWQHADVALRTAKERHEPHRYYDPKFDHYDPSRLALVGELRVAIETDQLLLHFQPKIDLGTGRTVAAEALVRWKHPTRGMLFPDTFIPLAERTGLINELTTWVVMAALRQGLAFAEAGCPLHLSVNLSARNLHDPDFSSELLRLVRDVGFPPDRLTLEITETAIMADPGRAKAVLGELRDAGIHLSMDDFGIGQSSLTYLKDLPISQMKIDKSFVIGFDQPRNVAIVRSAIDLARNMGLQVTAEGIEDEATCIALRELGCDLGQGYFFAKPISPEALLIWLRESAWGFQSS
jgi:diguanylate cyclase (GGDEF)-like protein/PAS domain S-box-containing protein